MKLIKSFSYAFNGLRTAWFDQPNLRIHSLVIMAVFGLGFYFEMQAWEWCVILLTGAIVISLELINTAVENLTDLATKEQNPLAGKVKDISAAAVLVAAMTSVIVGIIVFGKYFLQILNIEF